MGMTWAYGAADRDEAASIATIHRALELGVTLLDTADMYGPFTLNYECFALPDGGKTLVTYTAAPGSETALSLLATLCRQQDGRAVGDDDRVLEVG